MRRWRAGLAVALLALSGACAREPAGDELLVFAAASATDALTELGAAFEAETGSAVRFAFGSSGDLARQIRAGAPADVFVSADSLRMDELERAGLVRPADRRNLLSNQLVIVVPAGGRRPVGAPADLARLGRIAIADPDAVPAGFYAREWLRALGLWAEVEPKVVPALDARAALAAAESGDVEAAIVYRTDARAADARAAERVRVAYAVPREQCPAITYPVARLAAARHAAAAAAFVEFLGGERAGAVFVRHGFIVL